MQWKARGCRWRDGWSVGCRDKLRCRWPGDTTSGSCRWKLEWVVVRLLSGHGSSSGSASTDSLVASKSVAVRHVRRWLHCGYNKSGGAGPGVQAPPGIKAYRYVVDAPARPLAGCSTFNNGQRGVLGNLIECIMPTTWKEHEKVIVSIRGSMPTIAKGRLVWHKSSLV